GTPIKGFLGGFFELRAEKESLAKQLGTVVVDMIEASSIPVDKDLGDPERIDLLQLQITGLKDFALPTSPRQRVLRRNRNTLWLELRRDQRWQKGQPLKPEERTTFLQPTTTLPSDHELIRSKAREIVGLEKDLLKKADLLKTWVYRHVRQTMAANKSTALDVLQDQSGDCTEITMLFVALARASDIPAREVGGVIFANEGRPMFGWHAWAEVHDGHQWVSVDPTWNQLYIDATHIKLDEDKNDWSWVNLLGQMTIKVVKFTPRKENG
ncbi:MAG: transglutaminase-like domain-containing protein, partial [Verrucomicrobiota bacterium]